jgi:hypothetical protein
VRVLTLLLLLMAAPAFAADENATQAIDQNVVPSSEPVEEIPPEPIPAAKPKTTAESTPSIAPVEEVSKPLELNAVQLRALNKVTAKSQTIQVEIGKPVNFGNLEINLHYCWKSAPEDRPENAAMLSVNEARPGEANKQVFAGWMFSSSPGLSSLEHAVYDLTVIECVDKTPKKPAPAPEIAKEKKAKDAK